MSLSPLFSACERPEKSFLPFDSVLDSASFLKLDSVFLFDFDFLAFPEPEYFVDPVLFPLES